MDSFMIRYNVQPVPEPLRIQGVTTKMTPCPDDAEVAAHAFLESLSDPDTVSRKPQAKPKTNGAGYYRELSDRIKAGHREEERLALRFIFFCELELAGDEASLPDLEEGLFKHKTAAYRSGGGLKGRWQHCLAEVTLRMMEKAAADGLIEDE